MRYALLFCLAACNACGPTLEPIAPSARLAQLWAETESCSGLRGDFSAVRIYVTTNISGVAGSDYRLRSAYFRPGAIEDDGLVIHEWMHFLQFMNSDTTDFTSRGHPPELAAKCPRATMWEN